MALILIGSYVGSKILNIWIKKHNQAKTKRNEHVQDYAIGQIVLVPMKWFWTCSLRFVMMTSSNGNIFRVTGHLCGEFTGPGEFPAQRPVTRSFDVFFDLRLNKRLSKQSWGWWFETQSCPLWRQCNVIIIWKVLEMTQHFLCIGRYNTGSESVP